MKTDYHYLYHFRDPEKSAGFGFDGYVGITKDPKRREAEHLRALKTNQHMNKRLQSSYNESGGTLKMRIVKQGTEEEVLVSEALVINKPNKHANLQKGGGHLRGMSQVELLDLFGKQNKPKDSSPWETTPPHGIRASQVALIAAAFIAIGAGGYYGYCRFKKRKAVAADPVTDANSERLAREQRAERRASNPQVKPLHQMIWDAITSERKR